MYFVNTLAAIGTLTNWALGELFRKWKKGFSPFFPFPTNAIILETFVLYKSNSFIYDTKCGY